MPPTNALHTTGLYALGLHFASAGELVFVLVMVVPQAFFACCVLYLHYLLLGAVKLRRQVAQFSRLGKMHDRPGRALLPNSNATDLETAKVSHQRFVLLIPAHNEELLLGTVIESLYNLDYSPDSFKIVVIADNCTDQTAVIAREHGALTLERHNTDLVGKGYALEWALQLLLAGVQHAPDAYANEIASAADFDAVVILDADTMVSRNLLQAFDASLRAGNRVAQVRYDVMNTDESWRTKLMSCALALAHLVKPLGREWFRLSDGLKGNGMCFAREIVEHVPWSGESITEDIEYTLRVCRAGHRVAFLPQAAVWAQMPITGAQAASQRQRWEGGRYRLLFRVGPRLLKEALRSRNRLLQDRAIELIIPPFAEMFAVPLLLLTVCALIGKLTSWHLAYTLALLWASILFAQTLYLLVGMWVARMSASVVLSLLYVPIYIVWKFGVYAVMAVGRSTGGWKRTERHQI